jgi:hypothetical protein
MAIKCDNNKRDDIEKGQPDEKKGLIQKISLVY